MEIFQEIGGSENLQPFILSKLAIAISLKSGKQLEDSDFKKDNNGLELNHQTITGEYDTIFKALIEMFENKHIDNNTYFTKYIKAHIDRGAILLSSEQKYGNNFLLHLLNIESGI